MKLLAFDFETTYDYNMGYDNRAFPVCLCIMSTSMQKHWVFNHDMITQYVDQEQQIKEIQDIVNDADIIIAHNLKFDLHWLRRLGIDFSKKKLYCTQVAEYIIQGENNRVRYSLQETSLRYGIPPKHDQVKEWWDSGYDTTQVPLGILLPYCYQDTANTLALYLNQQPILEEKNLGKLTALACEMSRVLEDIEWNGMMIDKKLCQRYSDDYDKQIKALYDILFQFVRTHVPDLHSLPDTDNQGKPLPNFGSGEQLSAILFGGEFKYKGRINGKREGTIKNGDVILRTTGLGLIPRAGTETAKAGYFQTDKAQLQDLKVNNKIQRVFLEQLGELSKLEKMKGTYFDGMLKHELDSLVHCNIHQTRTVTGRFSATDPALQTIPRGSTSPVKQVFISRYKHA